MFVFVLVAVRSCCSWASGVWIEGISGSLRLIRSAKRSNTSRCSSLAAGLALLVAAWMIVFSRARVSATYVPSRVAWAETIRWACRS